MLQLLGNGHPALGRQRLQVKMLSHLDARQRHVPTRVEAPYVVKEVVSSMVGAQYICIDSEYGHEGASGALPGAQPLN